MRNKAVSASHQSGKCLLAWKAIAKWLRSGYFFALVVLISFLFVLYYGFDLYRDAFQHQRPFRWQDLGLSFGVLLIHLLAQVVVWQFIILKLGCKLSFRTVFQLLALANLGAYVPGRIWQMTGLFYLADKEQIPKKVTGTALLLSNALNLGAGALVFLVSLSFGFARATTATVVWLILVVIVSMLVSHPQVIQGALNLLLGWLGRSPVQFQLCWRDVLLFVSLYGMTWLLYGGSLVLLAGAMTAVSPEMIPRFMGAGAASYVPGYLAFVVPGGLGVREATLSGLLVSYLPLQTAIAISIFSRLLLVAAQALCAVVALLFRWIDQLSDREEQRCQHVGKPK